MQLKKSFFAALGAQGRVAGNPRNWPEIFKPQCLMYAVYGFLENVVGVRWIDPSDYGWSLPEDADLAVPVLGPKHIADQKIKVEGRALLINPLVTFASVHSPDRAVTIHLAK